MIVGIVGKKGSGKDTVAGIIQYLIAERKGEIDSNSEQDYKYRPQLKRGGFEIRKFAYKLKLICSILLNEPINKFENEKFKNSITKYGITVREFMQKVGTEAIRDNIHKDIWINSLMSEYIPDMKTGFPKWIITDVRFKNEAEAIKDIARKNNQDYFLIKVIRPNIINNDNHISEVELDQIECNATIINDGTIENLVKKVAIIL